MYDRYVSSFMLYLKYLYINVYLYMQVCHLLYVIKMFMTVHPPWLRNLVYDKHLFYSSYLEKAFFKFVANAQFLQLCTLNFHSSTEGKSTLVFCMLIWWACNCAHSYKALNSRIFLNLSLWLSFLSLPHCSNLHNQLQFSFQQKGFQSCFSTFLFMNITSCWLSRDNIDDTIKPTSQLEKTQASLSPTEMI